MAFNLKGKSKEEIHQLILDAALTMATEANWDNVSMRKLAARLGQAIFCRSWYSSFASQWREQLCIGPN